MGMLDHIRLQQQKRAMDAQGQRQDMAALGQGMAGLGQGINAAVTHAQQKQEKAAKIADIRKAVAARKKGETYESQFPETMEILTKLDEADVKKSLLELRRSELSWSKQEQAEDREDIRTGWDRADARSQQTSADARSLAELRAKAEADRLTQAAKLEERGAQADFLRGTIKAGAEGFANLLSADKRAERDLKKAQAENYRAQAAAAPTKAEATKMRAEAMAETSRARVMDAETRRSRMELERLRSQGLDIDSSFNLVKEARLAVGRLLEARNQTFEGLMGSAMGQIEYGVMLEKETDRLREELAAGTGVKPKDPNAPPVHTKKQNDMLDDIIIKAQAGLKEGPAGMKE